jgi:hypothetical protein
VSYVTACRYLSIPACGKDFISGCLVLVEVEFQFLLPWNLPVPQPLSHVSQNIYRCVTTGTGAAPVRSAQGLSNHAEYADVERVSKIGSSNMFQGTE